jgi:hypothetical protein
MKHAGYYIIGLMIFIMAGCSSVRYDTERYIINNIESHQTGDFISIRIMTLYNQANNKDGTHLEMTAYKYQDKKGLLISAHQYYKDRKRAKKDDTDVLTNTAFITLDTTQCRAIINNYNLLETKIKKENAQVDEEVFVDYTVSPDLYISSEKSKGTSIPGDIALWVKGEKYMLSTEALLATLDDFMKY